MDSVFTSFNLQPHPPKSLSISGAILTIPALSFRARSCSPPLLPSSSVVPLLALVVGADTGGDANELSKQWWRQTGKGAGRVAQEGGGRRLGELGPDDDARLLPLVPALLRSLHSPLPLRRLTRHARGSAVAGNGCCHAVLPTLPPSLADVASVNALNLSHVLRRSKARGWHLGRRHGTTTAVFQL
jgi:hypothetical protein